MNSDEEKYIRSCVSGVGHAVNKAAECLPKGWKVRIDIEHEGYGIYAVNPEGGEIDIDSYSIPDCINDAIIFANRLNE